MSKSPSRFGELSKSLPTRETRIREQALHLVFCRFGPSASISDIFRCGVCTPDRRGILGLVLGRFFGRSEIIPPIQERNKKAVPNRMPSTFGASTENAGRYRDRRHGRPVARLVSAGA
jgi:hypothetical protein